MSAYLVTIATEDGDIILSASVDLPEKAERSLVGQVGRAIAEVEMRAKE